MRLLQIDRRERINFYLSIIKHTPMMKDLRKYENLHVAFWLVKDACWCLLFKPLGMIMIIPTLYVAIDITIRRRHDRQVDLFHNIAITLWICANATWMTGSFSLTITCVLLRWCSFRWGWW
jgi:hypothetical protein